MKKHILVIVGDFYKDLSASLIEGAGEALDANGFSFDEVRVPGALEIPQALALTIASGKFDEEVGVYDGCIVLGAVIRGETSHYDTVSEQSTAEVLRLAIDFSVPLGNGILTVETMEQAVMRADSAQKNKGGGAALACLSLIDLNEALLGEESINV